MKQWMTLLIFAISLNAQASDSEVERWLPNWRLVSTARDSSLTMNESKYTFEFENLDGSNNVIRYSIDGIEGVLPLDESKICISSTPGKHIFQFFYTTYHAEVYTDSLEIQPGFHSIYNIRLDRVEEMMEVDKPVIYLYPEVKTEIELKVDIVGTPTFYYPAYDDSWKFTAMPSGDLIFGENTYNYLFWESHQLNSFTASERTTGFNVKGRDAISFLEEKLNAFGFTSKEKADFITFWGPRLAQNELNFVRFEYGVECCDKYAKLTISPEPTTLNRVYMQWMKIDKEIPLEEQVILPMPRNGFNVLEWGGFEMNYQRINNTDAVK